ncbi:HK97 family phage prohead protease [Corynebacterium sp. zg910]|nr:HK97 family phage prohead protease [Corynebacterium lujinxingii]
MSVHVVVGPPCAGKSTFVEQSAGPGVPRFDFDRMATVVGGVESNHDREPAVNEVTAVLRRAVMGWLLDPETVVDEFWLIDTNPSKATVERLEGIGAVFHLCDPGLDECLARAERDGRPEGTADRIRAWYANPPEIPGVTKGGPVRLKNYSADVRVKAAPTEGEAAAGRIEAYASVFDTVDSYGDVVRRGAFADTLKEWSDSGKTIPLLYGHNFSDPFMNIGGVVEASEDERGLKITADLDMDNPSAVQVLNLISKGRLSEMSFAFNYRDAGPATVDGDEIFEVRAVELFEVSVVPIGANRETEIVSAKSARELLTAVKQANLDAETEAAVVGALTRAAGDDEAEASPPPTPTDEGEEEETDALALHARARLAILERMGN